MGRSGGVADRDGDLLHAELDRQLSEVRAACDGLATRSDVLLAAIAAVAAVFAPRINPAHHEILLVLTAVSLGIATVASIVTLMPWLKIGPLTQSLTDWMSGGPKAGLLERSRSELIWLRSLRAEGAERERSHAGLRFEGHLAEAHRTEARESWERATEALHKAMQATEPEVRMDDAYYDEVRQAVGRGAPSVLLGTSTKSLERSLENPWVVHGASGASQTASRPSKERRLPKWMAGGWLLASLVFAFRLLFIVVLVLNSGKRTGPLKAPKLPEQPPGAPPHIERSSTKIRQVALTLNTD
jgi:hypothetical protein